MGMSMPKLHYHIWISEGGECCFLTVDKRPVGEAKFIILMIRAEKFNAKIISIPTLVNSH